MYPICRQCRAVHHFILIEALPTVRTAPPPDISVNSLWALSFEGDRLKNQMATEEGTLSLGQRQE